MYLLSTTYFDHLYLVTKQFLENHVYNLLVTQFAIPEESDDTNLTLATDNLLIHYYNAWIVYNQGLEYLNSLYT